jgi:hypothetical protein
MPTAIQIPATPTRRTAMFSVAAFAAGLATPALDSTTKPTGTTRIRDLNRQLRATSARAQRVGRSDNPHAQSR